VKMDFTRKDKGTNMAIKWKGGYRWFPRDLACATEEGLIISA
jgi:hypothetical protein